ncbi:hypothetical protein KFE25_008846 [Diacronema lutheri]|uniref:Uncharacterized protein n=2 Tax=Diacronema lutheri TaxID=2081491 RepID=A0A8J5Y2W0_DIALT|nr:hypothetical protein KFE25_008846 [Diacronema lutheri]
MLMTFVLSSIVGVWALRAHRQLRGHAVASPTRSARLSAAAADVAFGFARSEFGVEDLPGTCTPHDKHVFVLVAEAPSAWPAKWEESSGLPSALSNALKARKAEIRLKVKLTAATALADAGDAREGDILVFPEGIRVRNCSVANVDAVIDLLACVRTLGAGLTVEPAGARSAAQASGGRDAAVFVCAHTARDKRCGVIGPVLAEVFEDELRAGGRSDVRVRLCSHVGGHKYAGNAIVYAASEGHWYGYVDPAAAAEIVREHIVRGTPLIRAKLWRGQVGLSEDEQKAKCDGCVTPCAPGAA